MWTAWTTWTPRTRRNVMADRWTTDETMKKSTWARALDDETVWHRIRQITPNTNPGLMVNYRRNKEWYEKPVLAFALLDTWTEGDGEGYQRLVPVVDHLGELQVVGHDGMDAEDVYVCRNDDPDVTYLRAPYTCVLSTVDTSIPVHPEEGSR